MPTVESTDKATRKMISQINLTLAPRFPVKTTGEAIDYKSMRFATLTDLSGRPQFKAGLRVISKDYQFSPGQPIKVVSGMCLFGASGLLGITQNGEKFSLTDPLDLKDGLADKVIETIETPQLHPSEMETILQVTKALNLLGDTGVECFFHLPTTEYKLYLLEPFQQGKLSANQLEALFAKIDRRAQDLSRLVAKRLKIRTTFGTPLDPVEKALSGDKRRLTLDQCLQAARANPLLSNLIDIAQPSRFLNLCNLSYAAGYIGQALAAKRESAGCLAVDMAQEIAIFENTEKITRKLGVDLSLAAMFLAPIMLTRTGLHGKDSLFMHQPDGLSPLEEQKLIFRAAKGSKL
jgi:chorismate mutase